MPTKVESFVVCDDIRREINNKEILIGVYTGNIVLPSYPSVLRTAFWIELVAEIRGVSHWQMKIESPSGNPPIEMEFDMEVTEPGSASFSVGGFPIRVEYDGDLVVSMKENDGDWFVAKRKKVSRSALPPA